MLPSLKAKMVLQPDGLLFWAGSQYEKAIGKGTGHDNPPHAWAVRRGGWKLMQILEQGEPMLFDVANDPAESNDLNAVQPKIAAELRREFVDSIKTGADLIA